MPLFGIMLTGYLLDYFKVPADSASTIFILFVYIIALPALAFVKLPHVPVDEFFNSPFLSVLGGVMLLTFCLRLWVWPIFSDAT
jgi:predicted permease